MLFVVVVWGPKLRVDNLYGMRDGRSSFFADRCTCRLLTRTTENIRGPTVMRDDEEM
ncbi:hypothetical protein ARMGADRAFT_1021185 [Armillaria gallica]|uniref:Uncharacterized protein n=1 Tax=Armillaria gallica TaxID=47427 RepID=A0A2H3CTC7_ARMGA|nr:hypothetical protein ARMGADRAFT_1021185 [Armillaria gallica]